ncbi:hypothetical protein ACN47E_004775 [Coniothyrium glycines]
MVSLERASAPLAPATPCPSPLPSPSSPSHAHHVARQPQVQTMSTNQPPADLHRYNAGDRCMSFKRGMLPAEILVFLKPGVKRTCHASTCATPLLGRSSFAIASCETSKHRTLAVACTVQWHYSSRITVLDPQYRSLSCSSSAFLASL